MATTQVMIVEDQQMLVMGLRNILQRLGYNVSDVAASGDEALEKAGEKHHDVILMDIRLKGDMDGIEAARLVREQYDIPVIFVSAYADEDTLERLKVNLVPDPSGVVRISSALLVGEEMRAIAAGSVRIDIQVHVPRSAAARTAIAFGAPVAQRFVPSSGSTAMSTSGNPRMRRPGLAAMPTVSPM